MSKKKAKQNNCSNRTISISIPIQTDEYLEKFILDNARMYHHIRNDFVEEANKYKGEFNMYDDFDPRKFVTEYHNSVECTEDENGDIHDRYAYYCVGLSEQIAENFRLSRKTIRIKNIKVFNGKSSASLGEYRFKKFNFNRYSFRVKLKPGYVDNKFYSRLKIHGKDKIEFRVRSNQYGRNPETLYIRLNENLYDNKVTTGDKRNPLFERYYESNGYINICSFLLGDIKDICFKYEDGKYYVILITNVSYCVNKHSLDYSNGRIAGIDTGIRHPITIYDGDKTMYLNMDDETSRKIHYLERRIKRLQHYRSEKIKCNIETNSDNIYSNNVKKLDEKISKINLKITNIKRNWAKNISKQITTTYSIIAVDNFNIIESPDLKGLPNQAKRRINYAERFHKMFYVNEFIKHDAIKYGCKYVESPDYTTSTCSVCGHINPHPSLSQRFITCERCNSTIERDENAAKNCYNYIINNII